MAEIEKKSDEFTAVLASELPACVAVAKVRPRGGTARFCSTEGAHITGDRRGGRHA